jgi:hypothetical protein
MKHFRIAGLCLTAAVVVSAIAVATASAEAPEYGRCLTAKVGKKYDGKYDNAKCTPPVTETEKKAVEKGEGKFEWFPGVVKKFQTSVGGKGALEQVDTLGVGCAKERSTGEYSGTKEVKNLVVTFEGCESVGLECTSPGRKAGELVTKALEGTVVWENKALHKAALDLFPAEGAEKFIEFKCGAVLSFAVRGSILTPVKVDTMSLTVLLKYLEKHGIQKPTAYETLTGEKVNDFLESNRSEKGYVQAGQTITTTVTNEEKLELNAYV